ncbi:hypothetical protein ACFFHT_03365 [Gallibacterium melopsittaci]|uniref:Competence protein ComB n=1 Tax=Gallibacterium melopsittaci TaxID=516063 RepID=A0ABV6HUQ9_9PAST
MNSSMQTEINLLNWRQQHNQQRYRLISILLLLLFTLVAIAGYHLLQEMQQRSQKYVELRQQQQQINSNLQQIKQAQHRQQQLLNHHSAFEKIPLEEIVQFIQQLSHLPLGNGRLLLAQMEINPFSGEQQTKLNFILMGENLIQQEFYQLQQYLLLHWHYPIELEPSVLQQNQQKQSSFTLRFNKKEEQ